MSQAPGNDDASVLLSAVAAGDREGMNRLFDMVYDRLRGVAERQMRPERTAHTLSPTALAHEAYIKLIDQNQVDLESRSHFLAISAKAMRQVLVDHARTKTRKKRGGEAKQHEFEEQKVPLSGDGDLVEILSLEDALEQLQKKSERQAKVVELRVFAGMSIEEIAVVLDVAPRTVDGDWAVARAWLRRELDKS